ncbi:alkaline phosphatase D family protein [Pseudobacteriovorax antillogorgiicola]|uniref:Alkaline phosphatase D n=1 Tax=Pseudobacteriovorax antillogorgiicola TaxID=1513793 RepID=A0A1Y6CTI5_9BACT|nr:alkaline phosphatase D family protein [Pseudobacteriovorax antillogorgiicola]TCS45690.1 alkaline phosphatase D [Pseudobacteriovorax antillogorgiicola]SMF73269.1 alkaline phosphatase D [Pseudobacteriovorax antillogorgiicola]
MKFSRRAFLKTATAATPITLSMASPAQAWFFKKPKKSYERSQWLGYQFPSAKSAMIFSCGIASGDPSPTGVLLWTRINPEMIRDGASLFFEVSHSPDFHVSSRVCEGQISAEKITNRDDYTIKLVLEGCLDPVSTYYYRFSYDQSYSPIGRCRTLPEKNQSFSELNLASASCQDFGNGFYSAYRHLAHNQEVDFVVHLGDFIYETTGDTSFQNGALAERQFQLSTGSLIAETLDDYREIYRHYRKDIDLQEAMAAHTWIMVPDDHETANDFFWDYESDTPVMPDHPIQSLTSENDRLEASVKLRLGSQKAWTEYVPAQVDFDPNDLNPFTNLKLYRSFEFGDLVNLNMIDTRSYRSAPPCGLETIGGRYLPKLRCDSYKEYGRTMLGEEQKYWLFNRLNDNDSVWPVIGNQTFMGRLGLQSPKGAVPINVDAWDGYEAERRELIHVMQDQGHNNHIVLTGDLHTYIASHLKLDHDDLSPFNWSNHVGAEFMTSSITSAGLNDQVLAAICNDNRVLSQGLRYTAEALIRVQNPHIKRFNSKDHGYSMFRFRRYHMEWLGLTFDKNIPHSEAQIVHHLQKVRHVPWVTRSPASEVDAKIL